MYAKTREIIGWMKVLDGIKPLSDARCSTADISSKMPASFQPIDMHGEFVSQMDLHTESDQKMRDDIMESLIRQEEEEAAAELTGKSKKKKKNKKKAAAMSLPDGITCTLRVALVAHLLSGSRYLLLITHSFYPHLAPTHHHFSSLRFVRTCISASPSLDGTYKMLLVTHAHPTAEANNAKDDEDATPVCSQEPALDVNSNTGDLNDPIIIPDDDDDSQVAGGPEHAPGAAKLASFRSSSSVTELNPLVFGNVAGSGGSDADGTAGSGSVKSVAPMDLSTWTPDFSTQFGPLGNFADFSFLTGYGAAAGNAAANTKSVQAPASATQGDKAASAQQHVNAATSVAASDNQPGPAVESDVVCAVHAKPPTDTVHGCEWTVKRNAEECCACLPPDAALLASQASSRETSHMHVHIERPCICMHACIHTYIHTYAYACIHHIGTAGGVGKLREGPSSRCLQAQHRRAIRPVSRCRPQAAAHQAQD